MKKNMKALSLMMLTVASMHLAAEEGTRAPSSGGSCRLSNGYVSVTVQGTGNEAYMKAIEVCGDKTIAYFTAQRGELTVDQAEDLVLSCANAKCQ